MTRVWEYSKHKGNALLILLAIADFADDYGAAFPSIKKLAEKARISERQTIRIIKKLEDSKELNVKHRRNQGNYYLIMLEELGDKLSLRESVSDDEKESVSISDIKESHELSDTLSQLESDTIESHDPPLTVIKPSQTNARESEVQDTEEQSSEASRDIAPREGEEEDDPIQWFNDKKEAEIKSGVRPPARELPKAPRSEDDIEMGVRSAIVENAIRNVQNDPAIESYLAAVPEHVRELARVFCYHKMRAPLENENAMWRKEWQDQFDIGLNAENIHDAIEYMKNNNLAVRSPMSTLTIAENIRNGHIQLERGDTSGKISETSQSLAGDDQVDTVDTPEVSPMDVLLQEKSEGDE